MQWIRKQLRALILWALVTDDTPLDPSYFDDEAANRNNGA